MTWTLAGLILSSIGDVFMVWRSQLVPGMAAFALAQVSYIKAFGFSPLKLNIGIALFLLTVGGKKDKTDLTYEETPLYFIALLILIPGLMHDQFLLMGLPVYCVLLTVMAWRANARFFSEDVIYYEKLSSYNCKFLLYLAHM
jgi:uncharacterized membrane protein YhhN